MAEPYEVLGVEPNASEELIRKRYLELVRQFPPDREPVRFAELHQAYDQMRDPIRQMRSLILGTAVGSATIHSIAADFHRRQLKDQRIPARILLNVAENLKS